MAALHQKGKDRRNLFFAFQMTQVEVHGIFGNAELGGHEAHRIFPFKYILLPQIFDDFLVLVGS